MKKLELKTLQEIETVASHFLQETSDAKIIAFFGSMGVGKTTFIKAVCKHLGVVNEVTSPTFSIINEYNTVDNNTVYHFDFYRIKDIEEAFDIGFEEYLLSGNYCFIEWPEKIISILPEDAKKVIMDESPDHTRIIEFE